MQYKIPVQIENEDPIMFWLGLRQLTTIMLGWGFSYMIFNSLAKQSWPEIAAIPAGIIFLFFVLVAVFKNSEMTFIPFILAFIRLKINDAKGRYWIKWIDSYQPIDIWYVIAWDEKVEKTIDFKSKIDKINELTDKIDKI